jgi:hypothetical protein
MEYLIIFILGNVNQNDNNVQNDIPIEPIRPYLLSTVYEVVRKGLIELDKARPDNPLEFLGKYILSAASHN